MGPLLLAWGASLVVLAGAQSPRAEASAAGVAFYGGGVDPSANTWERGSGSASLSVVDRATAHFSMRFVLGIIEYRVELDEPGFPPSISRPLRPDHPVGGGVMLDTEVFGSTGLGRRVTQAHAAIALWGLGRLYRENRLLTNQAVVEVMALSAGFHSDDDTFSVLNQARPGDTELLVLLTELPAAADTRGFLSFGFDDVNITLGGEEVPKVASIPNEAGAGSGIGGSGATGYSASGTPVPSPYGMPAPTAASAAGATSNIPQGIEPSNAVPGTPSLATPSPRLVPTELASTPAPSSAALNALPTTPAPLSSAPGLGQLPALPLPHSGTPSNAGPAIPLPSTVPVAPPLPPALR